MPTRRSPLCELPRNILNAELRIEPQPAEHTNPQDIPDRSQSPEAIVQRPSGVVEEPLADQRWLDDDWWEDPESIQANEGGGNDLRGDNTEVRNPLPEAVTYRTTT